MERKIGDTFEFEGKKLQVKESASNGCDGCFFYMKCSSITMELSGECEVDVRDDGKNVIFVEVQEQQTEEPKERKVGEVFECEGKELKVVKAKIRCGNCFFHNGRGCKRINRTTGECKSSNRSDNESVVFIEITEEQAEQPQKLNLCEILKYCPQGEPFWSPMLGDVKLCYIDPEAEHVTVTIKIGATWDINANGTITIDDVTSEEIMLYPSREQRDWTKVKYEKKKERFDPKTLKPFDKVVVSNIQNNTWHIEYFSHIEERCKPYPFYCLADNFAYCIPYNDETKHLLGTKEEAPEFYKYWED